MEPYKNICPAEPNHLSSIYAPEGLFSCPGGPEDVARKVTAMDW